MLRTSFFSAAISAFLLVSEAQASSCVEIDFTQIYLNKDGMGRNGKKWAQGKELYQAISEEIARQGGGPIILEQTLRNMSSVITQEPEGSLRFIPRQGNCTSYSEMQKRVLPVFKFER
jgi:hypothetical protein